MVFLKWVLTGAGFSPTFISRLKIIDHINLLLEVFNKILT
jgi:hypothetical protein